MCLIGLKLHSLTSTRAPTSGGQYHWYVEWCYLPVTLSSILTGRIGHLSSRHQSTRDFYPTCPVCALPLTSWAVTNTPDRMALDAVVAGRYCGWLVPHRHSDSGYCLNLRFELSGQELARHSPRHCDRAATDCDQYPICGAATAHPESHGLSACLGMDGLDSSLVGFSASCNGS